MKISLSITSSHQIRFYYENQDDNISKYIDPNELEINGTSLLLLNTIKKMFNEFKNSNDTYSDITEVNININAWWNFELWSFPEILESTPIINIKKVWDQTIQEFIVNSSMHSLSFEWWLFYNLQFQDIKCDSLLFSDVTIEKTILFKKVQWINKLTFDSCKWTSVSDEVTRLEFDECKNVKQLNLVRTSFWYIIIVDSEINNVFPYKIHFDKVEHIGNKNAFNNLLKKNWELENSSTEIKDYYRQLKYSHDQIWNKTEANKFFAKEMEYYMNSLSWRHDFWKKLVSSINMCVNDYGNNWWLPIIWMFLITYYAAFYKFCYLQESGTFWELFINSILPISDIGNFYSFLDLLYKLTWAFLVYQFIIALRRISQR